MRYPYEVGMMLRRINRKPAQPGIVAPRRVGVIVDVGTYRFGRLYTLQYTTGEYRRYYEHKLDSEFEFAGYMCNNKVTTRDTFIDKQVENKFNTKDTGHKCKVINLYFEW